MPIGGLISGLIGGAGSFFAGNQQADALKQGIDLEKQQWQQTTKNMLPYVQAGYTGLNALLNDISGGSAPTGFNLLEPVSSFVGPAPSPNAPGAVFQASPGYQYQLNQAMNAVQNSAAGRTGAVSGNMLRGLQSNATGLAGQDYWNWYNAVVNNYLQRYSDFSNMRNQGVGLLSNLASQGQNAAANLGTTGTQAVSNIAGLLGTLGSSQAASTLGATNALSNSFNSGGTGSNMLNYLFGYGGGGGGTGNLFSSSGGGGPSYTYNPASVIAQDYAAGYY